MYINAASIHLQSIEQKEGVGMLEQLKSLQPNNIKQAQIFLEKAYQEIEKSRSDQQSEDAVRLHEVPKSVECQVNLWLGYLYRLNSNRKR